MSDENPMGQVIQIDEGKIRDPPGRVVRSTVEETLNALLDAEADRLCEPTVTNAARPGRTPGPVPTSGQLQTRPVK